MTIMVKTYLILSTKKQMSQRMKQRMNIKVQRIRMTRSHLLFYVEVLEYGKALKSPDGMLW